MTPAGLYRWPDSLENTFIVGVSGGFYQCPVWAFGVQMDDANCQQVTTVPSADIDPTEAKDFVGIAPNTPADLVYPADGQLVEDYLFASDFDPPPDYVDIRPDTSILEGPSGYFTTCATPNEVGGPTSGGCDGFTEPDVVETITIPSGVGTIAGGFVSPPSELAFDDSEEGARLWPFSHMSEALLTASYSGAEDPEAQCHTIRIRYRVLVRLYWVVEPTEPVPGTIEIGTLARGVRRRVVTRS